jgi:hypothetical protein
MSSVDYLFEDFVSSHLCALKLGGEALVDGIACALLVD